MLLALEFFLVGEFLAGGGDLVLRLDVRGIRPARLSVRLAGAAAEAAPDPADLQAGGKAFQVALLLVGKIDCRAFRSSWCATKLLRPRGVASTKWGNRAEPRRMAWVPGGPTSFVAAEIHLDAAGRHLRRPTALQHTSCVPRPIS